MEKALIVSASTVQSSVPQANPQPFKSQPIDFPDHESMQAGSSYQHNSAHIHEEQKQTQSSEPIAMTHKKRTIENLDKIQSSSNKIPEQHVQDNFPADIETAFDQNSDYERETDEEFQKVNTRPTSIPDTSAFAVGLISSNAIMTLSSNQLAEFDIESTDTAESFNEFAPSASESTIDDDIRVPSRPVRGEISDFCLALGLWCDKEGIKRRTYDGLLEVLQLLDIHEVRNLPKRLSTLHSWCRKRLPLPSIQKAAISVRREKQPTGTPRPAQANVYYFDTRTVISILLSATTQRNIHIGMAEIVDSPSEYWHSNSWGSSIRTCSTDFARFPDSSPIFPLTLCSIAVAMINMDYS